jgi:hypothetical protein
MKVKLFVFTCLAAVAVLPGCGGGASGNSSTPTPDTVANSVTKALATNVIPTLNTDAGLTIIDANNNGVRDDVDALIRSKYTTTTHLSAATQYARAVQMAVTASAPSTSNIPIIATALVEAVDCAFAQMGASNSAAMISDVRAATTNTKERFMAYRETQAALSGQHAVISEVDPKTFCK